MGKKKARFSVWECECGATVIMGQQCPICHSNYGEVQLERKKAKAETKKRTKKLEPVWKGEYIESYLRLKK